MSACGRTPADFAADITRRSIWAINNNEGRPYPAWSTGERLIVALVLGDAATLEAERYTRQEALQRLGGDLAYYGYDKAPVVWLADIRATLGITGSDSR